MLTASLWQVLRSNVAMTLFGTSNTQYARLGGDMPPPGFWRTAFFALLASMILSRVLLFLI